MGGDDVRQLAVAVLLERRRVERLEPGGEDHGADLEHLLGRSTSSWLMHSFGQTSAQTLQPPVRKCTQYSGSMRGHVRHRLPERDGDRGIRPERDLGVHHLAARRLLHPDVPGRAAGGARSAQDAGVGVRVERCRHARGRRRVRRSRAPGRRRSRRRRARTARTGCRCPRRSPSAARSMSELVRQRREHRQRRAPAHEHLEVEPARRQHARRVREDLDPFLRRVVARRDDARAPPGGRVASTTQIRHAA